MKINEHPDIPDSYIRIYAEAAKQDQLNFLISMVKEKSVSKVSK